MKYKESETIELKKSTSELKEAIISMSAILNKHKRGELYFGIRDDGRVVGQDAGKRTLRDISRAISAKIEPKIYPVIRLIKIDSKVCIKISFKGKHTPYFAFGRAYIRVADENWQMSARELENLILKKNKDKLCWDKEVCPQAKVSDISVKKLKAFLKIAGLKYDTALNALAKLKIIRGRKLRNAAVILFAKTPQKFFPNAKLRCAVFARRDTALIIDRKEFEGDIFYLIEKAQEYILEHLHIGMRVEGLYRIDVPEIDKEAFREAIINAFCHRDYREDDSVNIAIFKDRLEIRSPGLLYGGLTIEKIRTESVSERRNELIAELFHRIHIVEKWGRGIALILLKEPAVVFKEVGRQFIVVFKRKKTAEPLTRKKVAEKVVRKGGQISGQKKRQVGVVEKVVENVPQRLAERLVEGLAENQKKILDLMKARPYISKRELSHEIGISPTAIDKNIKVLKEKKLLKRVGPDRGGHWKAVMDTKEAVERLVEGLVENRKKILDLMKARPYISKRELSDEIGISATAIDKNIMALKEKELLKRIGPDRGGHWKVVVQKNV